MFVRHAKEVLREADTTKSLVCHKGSEEVELLALVKKKKTNLPFSAKYEVLSTKLVHLIPSLSAHVAVTEEDFVKDFKSSGQISVSADVQGGFDMVSAAAGAGGSSQQESSAVTIKMKTVDLPSLKKGYRDQEIDSYWLPKLEKGEVLGFVDRIIYNTDDLKLRGQTAVDGHSKVSWSPAFGLSVKGSVKGETSYTVPAGRVYAYAFNGIKFQSNKIEETTRSHVVEIQRPSERIEEIRRIMPKHQLLKHVTSTENAYKNLIAVQSAAGIIPAHETFEDDNSAWNTCQLRKMSSDGTTLAPETFEAENTTENTYENLQQIQDELQKIEGVLQPLSHVPSATRSTLFQRLCQVSEEKDAVTALKEALGLWYEQQRFHLPQSASASSTLDLLRLASSLLTGLTDMYSLLGAVYMLVSAMDQLPDHIPAVIAKCSPDTLRALNHLVSSIRDRGEVLVSQPLPGPLQPGGELHWLTEFLCSTDEMLQDLELTMVAEETPGVLLLALCITVRGLHMMQGEQSES